MKKDIHITVEEDTLKELNRIAKIIKVNKSVLLDMIIVDGMEKIKELDYNISKLYKQY